MLLPQNTPAKIAEKMSCVVGKFCEDLVCPSPQMSASYQIVPPPLGRCRRLALLDFDRRSISIIVNDSNYFFRSYVAPWYCPTGPALKLPSNCLAARQK